MCRNYSREETIWGNTVYISTVTSKFKMNSFCINYLTSVTVYITTITKKCTRISTSEICLGGFGTKLLPFWQKTFTTNNDGVPIIWFFSVLFYDVIGFLTNQSSEIEILNSVSVPFKQKPTLCSKNETFFNTSFLGNAPPNFLLTGIFRVIEKRSYKIGILF